MAYQLNNLQFRIAVLQNSKLDELCEDVFVWQCLGSSRRMARFVLSDGAGATAYPVRWARILSDAFANGQFDPLHPSVGSQFSRCKKRWESFAESSVRELDEVSECIVRPRVDRGAAATLAAVTLGVWQESGMKNAETATIQVLGDSCVILHRADRQNDICFPTSVREFSETSVFLCSAGNVPPIPLACSTRVFPGDEILLMSDALARWYLGREFDPVNASAERRAILKRFVDTHHSSRKRCFEHWLREMQHAGKIENDDVTLVWISLLERKPVRKG